MHYLSRPNNYIYIHTWGQKSLAVRLIMCVVRLGVDARVERNFVQYSNIQRFFIISMNCKEYIKMGKKISPVILNILFEKSKKKIKTSFLSGWQTHFIPPTTIRNTTGENLKRNCFCSLIVPPNSALTFVIPGQVGGAGEVHHRSGRSIWPAGVSVKGSVAEQVCVKEKNSKKQKSSRCEKSILI